jgi:hypothetical protein
MNLLPLVAWSALLAPASVETLFVQVAPKMRPEGEWLRGDATRAVVLIQGLKVQPFPKADTGRASLREWQQPGSVLVRTLATTGDVYAFAYGQNVPLDQIAETTSLRAGTRRLREMGYREVVLVGYSAGGIVARQLVEDYPGTGVTKVIQVCAPNAGSGWARVDGIPRGHKPFQRSLTKEERGAALRARLAVTIPEGVEFVCVVGTVALTGDGVVSCRSQWSEDLQAQGVPAVGWAVDHLSVVRSPQHAERLADLVRLPQRRWTQAEVAAGRKAVLGEGLASWRRAGAASP